MREVGMRNIAEQGCFHAPLFTRTYFLGHSSGSVLACWRRQIDANWWTRHCSRQTVHQSLPAATSTSTTNWKIHRCTLWDEKRKKTSIPSHFNDKDSRWVTTVSSSGSPPLPMEDNNKRPPPLTQKSLKVTEWILIRSGVVNGSQHGLQWD